MKYNYYIQLFFLLSEERNKALLPNSIPISSPMQRILILNAPPRDLKQNFESSKYPTNYIRLLLPHSSTQSPQSSEVLSKAVTSLNPCAPNIVFTTKLQPIPKLSNTCNMIYVPKEVEDKESKLKRKSSLFVYYTEEDYKKGVENLNLPARMLLNTLENNPKILFVQLNRIDNSPKGSLYSKTRNRSLIKVLSPREVKEKASHDLQLMYNTIKTKILVSAGKINKPKDRIKPLLNASALQTRIFNCTVCDAEFFDKVSLVDHIDSYHPEFPLISCTLCDRKFLLKRGMLVHKRLVHEKPKQNISSTDSDDFSDYSKNADVLNKGSPMSSKMETELYKVKGETESSTFQVISDINLDEQVVQEDKFEYNYSESEKFDQNLEIISSNNNLKSEKLNKFTEPVNIQPTLIPNKSDDYVVKKIFTSPKKLDIKFIVIEDDNVESNITVKEDSSNSICNDQTINDGSQTSIVRDNTFPHVNSSPNQTHNVDILRSECQNVSPIQFEAPEITENIIENCQLSFSSQDLEFLSKNPENFETKEENGKLLIEESISFLPTVELSSSIMEEDQVLCLTDYIEIDVPQSETEEDKVSSRKSCHSLVSSEQPHFDKLSEAIETESLGALKVESSEAVKIESSEAVEIESSKTVEIESSEAVEIESSEAVEIESSEAVEIESSEAVKIESSKAVEIESLKAVEIESSEAVEIESSKTVEIESSKIVEIESPEAVEIEPSEAVKIESAKVIKSTLIEPNFRCCVCRKNFDHEQQLLAHLFTYHRNNHPFTCDVCFLCYKHMEDLKEHVKIHGKEIHFEHELDSLEFATEDNVCFAKSNTKEEKSILIESVSSVDHQVTKKSHAGEFTVTQDPTQTEQNNLKSSINECILPGNLQKSNKENSPAESNILKESSVKCDLSNLQSNAQTVGTLFHFGQKDSPSKRKKPKISCVVEKVEYPLDIHNLYANIRKVDDPKVVNRLDLELQSTLTSEIVNSNSLTDETKNYPVNNANLFPMKRSFEKEKASTSFSNPAKRMKVMETINFRTDKEIFKCNICKKVFDINRTYSEHMFFMHDVIIDEAVVKELLKPNLEINTTTKKNKVNSTLRDTGYRINNSTISTETNVTTSNRTKKSGLLNQGNSEKSETSEKIMINDENSTARNCNECGKRYVEVTSYFQHRYDIHGDDSLVHVCENCGTVMITVSMVNLHMCTQVNTFSCKDCAMDFDNATALKEHNTSKHFETIGPHVCHDCRKCFLTNRMLQKHRRITHSDSSVTVSSTKGTKSNQVCKRKLNCLTCPVCKFVLHTTRRLQAHLMVNHSKATDICFLCNKLFAFGRGIRHILDFHLVPNCNENKEYDLSWDGDPKKDVNEVIDVLGEKRLLAICNYDNYRKLTDPACFECQVCKMPYSAIRYYRNHYILQHELCCALCDKFFKSSKEFSFHVEKVHDTMKHYLWFAETIISTIMQTERNKVTSGNFQQESETLMQIIRRKLEENEVNAASRVLEQMEQERISDNTDYCEKSQSTDTYEIPEMSSEESVLTTAISIPECELLVEANESPAEKIEPPIETCNMDILELPDFCMEYEINDNETVVTENPNYFANEIVISSVSNENECTEEAGETKKAIDSTNLNPENCNFESSVNVNDSSIVNLK